MSSLTYEVLLFPTAEQDLGEIREYFEQVLKTSANPLFEKFLHHISILETDPLIYSLVKDPTLRGKGYRTIAVDNFLMFFIIVGTEVHVHRFLYGGRNYTSFL